MYLVGINNINYFFSRHPWLYSLIPTQPLNPSHLGVYSICSCIPLEAYQESLLIRVTSLIHRWSLPACCRQHLECYRFYTRCRKIPLSPTTKSIYWFTNQCRKFLKTDVKSFFFLVWILLMLAPKLVLISYFTC